MHFFFDKQKTSSNKYMLDQVSVSPAVAYSLRKLRKGYTGSPIRVRRSSDNAEQDIGFTASGGLDTTSLVSFVGLENLLTYSEQFDNGAWSKNDTTVTANQITAPDDTLTGDLATFNANGSCFLRQTVTVTPLTQYTFSFYAKKGTATNLGYSVYNATGGADIVASTSYYSSINSTTWTRVSVTFTTPSGCTSIFVYTERGLATTGTTAYFWGAQVNTGATAKTYNKTVAGIGGDGYITKWYNQTGNSSYDAVQATAANQPRIVSAGVVDVDANGKPVVRCVGDVYRTLATASRIPNNTIYGTGEISINQVIQANSEPIGFTSAVGTRDDSGSWWSFIKNPNNTIGFHDSEQRWSASTLGLNKSIITDIVNSSDKLNEWLNGTQIQTNVTVTAFTIAIDTKLYIGCGSRQGGHEYFRGDIQEVILFTKAISDTDRVKIESSQGKYYNVANPWSDSLTWNDSSVWTE